MKTPFRFGDWVVDPIENVVEAEGEKRQMEPRTMAVLVALCDARGELLSADELLTQCWGSTLSGDSPLHKNIAQLRRILGDSANAPRYIETVRMRGYRTVAPLDFSTFEPSARKSWHGGSPFRGLLAFDADHADVFFGRDDATRQLIDAADAQADSALALLLVLGPSGSGKTSVVQAGLLPALARPRPSSALRLLASTTFDLFDQGEQTLFTALAGSLLDLQWEDKWAFDGDNAQSLGARLEHDCASVIAQLIFCLDGRPATRFGIFIDRFEALFNATRIDAPARAAFLRTLDALARSSAVLLIVACRNDFYPDIAQYPLLTEGKRHGGHVDLEPPAFADIAQMIRRPAEAAKLTFGADPATGARLDDILCASAAGRPDALPLLQYCLQELYRLRTPEGELSLDAFHQLGDLEGAIGQRAEQVVLALSDDQRAALDHIMSLVIILSTDGTSVSSQRVSWSALNGDAARQAVTQLIDARLFVSDLVGGAPVFGIAHDAILRRWPRMTGWIDAHRSALAVRSRLAQHASRWVEEGRPGDLLLPSGKPLDEAVSLQLPGAWSLTPDEQELIAASRRRVRQRARGRMAGLALIVALALLAVGLGISAQLAKRAEQARRAEAEGLLDFMLGDFADKLRPLGRLDLLESVSSKALQYLSGSDESDIGSTALTLRAKGLQTISEVSRAKGDTRHALDALKHARSILERQLQGAPHNVQILKNLGTNAYWMARIYKDLADVKAARDAGQKYLYYSDQLHIVEPDSTEWWIEQSYAHNNLGALALGRSRPDEAAPEFAASIALKKRALARMPQSSSVAAELADSYSWLALARQSLGELTQAEQLYRQEMDAVLKLRARFPSESMWIYGEVRALQHRAEISLALGLDARALQDYNTALHLFAPIVAQDQKNRNWQIQFAAIEQARLQVVARDVGKSNIVKQLETVRETFAHLLSYDPANAAWARRTAEAGVRLAKELVPGSLSQRQVLEHALISLTALYASNPSDLPGKLILVEGLLVSATMQQKTNNPASLLSCRQAYGIISSEAQNTKNYKVLDPWLRINVCLQNINNIRTASKKLKDIGYRDTEYLHLISIEPSV
jgi:DNA-binding winged helix-turn-helix (wHTH) protein/tetratricopeptide (TPR) repeat protein